MILYKIYLSMGVDEREIETRSECFQKNTYWRVGKTIPRHTFLFKTFTKSRLQRSNFRGFDVQRCWWPDGWTLRTPRLYRSLFDDSLTKKTTFINFTIASHFSVICASEKPGFAIRRCLYSGSGAPTHSRTPRSARKCEDRRHSPRFLYRGIRIAKI